jgi:hypothetical protein
MITQIKNLEVNINVYFSLKKLIRDILKMLNSFSNKKIPLRILEQLFNNELHPKLKKVLKFVNFVIENDHST